MNKKLLEKLKRLALAEHYARIGEMGGSSTSEKKREAARKNAEKARLKLAQQREGKA